MENRQKAANNPKSISNTDWVKKNLEELGIVLENSELLQWKISDENYVLRFDELVIKIRCHRDEQREKNISKEIISEILSNMENNTKQRIIDDFKDKIKFDANLPDKFEELARFIAKDKYEEMYPVILKNMIWTIKRRLSGQSHYIPLFINIYGDKGCGKTELLKAMFSIVPPSLKSLTSNAAQLFNDERESFRFIKNYVIIMNEISGLNKSDLNMIKNQIDAHTIVYRLLGHNKIDEGFNNAQLIGTSNTRLANTLMADTDVRKWAEINMHKYSDDEVPEKMVIPLINFDWLTLWKSVDENAASPFHDAKTYFRFTEWTSKVCRHESATVLYIDELLEEKAGDWVSKKEMYDNGYRKEVLDYPLNWPNFKEKLEKYGCKSHKKETGIGMLIPSKKENLRKLKNADEDYSEIFNQ